MKYPSATVPEYTNGQKCGAGTPDAGKVGEVQARWWVLSTKTGKNGELQETGGLTTVKPADLKLLNRQLITVGFVPANEALPKPPAVDDHGPAAGAGREPARRHDHDDDTGVTTTTAHMLTPTTAPGVTTTTSAATTTTKPVTTTTTKPLVTTTTK